MDWLLNPWTILIILFSLIIGNITALKAVDKMNFNRKKKQTEDNKIKKEEKNTSCDDNLK